MSTTWNGLTRTPIRHVGLCPAFLLHSVIVHTANEPTTKCYYVFVWVSVCLFGALYKQCNHGPRFYCLSAGRFLFPFPAFEAECLTVRWLFLYVGLCQWAGFASLSCVISSVTQVYPVYFRAALVGWRPRFLSVVLPLNCVFKMERMVMIRPL